MPSTGKLFTSHMGHLLVPDLIPLFGCSSSCRLFQLLDLVFTFSFTSYIKAGCNTRGTVLLSAICGSFTLCYAVVHPAIGHWLLNGSILVCSYHTFTSKADFYHFSYCGPVAVLQTSVSPGCSQETALQHGVLSQPLPAPHGLDAC